MTLLQKWQPVENLISPSTLPYLWRRHVADSAQLYALFPVVTRFLDLGTGAGFPGLVLAILGAGRAGFHVDLVESNQRKCAFLRAVVRETGAPATVHHGRAEHVVPQIWQGSVNHDDYVTSRALAPLSALLGYAGPLLRRGAFGAFHKGGDWQREVDEARREWDFELVPHPSRVGAGAILEISALRGRGESA